MEREGKVLIVTTKFGFGHLGAAEALGKQFQTQPGVTANILDITNHPDFPFQELPAFYDYLSRRPNLWSAIFNLTNNRLLSDPDFLFGRFITPGIKRAIDEFSPDVVLSTALGINGTLAKALGKTPLEVVVTDLNQIHRSWVPWKKNAVNRFFVPTTNARENLRGYGVNTDSIMVTGGLPVKSDFLRAPTTTKSEILQAHQLDPRLKTILYMLDGTTASLKGLRALSEKKISGAQLLVVCGRNEDLLPKARRLLENSPGNVLGFTQNMPDLMRASSMIVSKAGGLTVTEAIVSGLALVIYHPMPGQEIGNTNYLLEQGAAEYARSRRELVQLAENLAYSPQRRSLLVQNAQELIQPNAGNIIVADILNRLRKSG